MTLIPSSFQFSSVAQSCLTRCNPMNCSTPGLPVHHQLNVHESEQMSGDSKEQGSLAYCSFSSVQLLSHVWLFLTPWTAVCQASLSFSLSQSLLKFMFIESVMPSNHLILCHPLLLLPSIFPSIRVFSNELTLCIRWPKYWSFSFSISPFSEYSGLISFRIDWFDLLAVQGTLNSLPQHHSSKASVLYFLIN